MPANFDDERLQRMMDGDLPNAEAEELRSALEQDAAATAALARHERMGHLLREAGSAWQAEVDSDGLFARIEADLEADLEAEARAEGSAEADAMAEEAGAPQGDVIGDVIRLDQSRKPKGKSQGGSRRRADLWMPAAGAVALAAAVLLTVFRPVSPEELGEVGDDATPTAPSEGAKAVDATDSEQPPSAQPATPTPNHSDVVQVDFGDHAGAVFDVELSGGASTPVIWINE